MYAERGYMVSAIFTGITSSVTAFIGTLNSGITGMLALFYDDSALTVLGTLTVIVVGVSLVYFLFRLIMGLARLRG